MLQYDEKAPCEAQLWGGLSISESLLCCWMASRIWAVQSHCVSLHCSWLKNSSCNETQLATSNTMNKTHEYLAYKIMYNLQYYQTTTHCRNKLKLNTCKTTYNKSKCCLKTDPLGPLLLIPFLKVTRLSFSSARFNISASLHPLCASRSVILLKNWSTVTYINKTDLFSVL